MAESVKSKLFSHRPVDQEEEGCAGGVSKLACRPLVAPRQTVEELVWRGSECRGMRRSGWRGFGASSAHSSCQGYILLAHVRQFESVHPRPPCARC